MTEESTQTNHPNLQHMRHLHRPHLHPPQRQRLPRPDLGQRPVGLLVHRRAQHRHPVREPATPTPPDPPPVPEPVLLFLILLPEQPQQPQPPRPQQQQGRRRRIHPAAIRRQRHARRRQREGRRGLRPVRRRVRRGGGVVRLRREGGVPGPDRDPGREGRRQEDGGRRRRRRRYHEFRVVAVGGRRRGEEDYGHEGDWVRGGEGEGSRAGQGRVLILGYLGRGFLVMIERLLLLVELAIDFNTRVVLFLFVVKIWQSRIKISCRINTIERCTFSSSCCRLDVPTVSYA